MAKRNIRIEVELEEYDSEADLAVEDKALLDAARKVAKEAYAPYSDFFVGAAVRLANGKVISGSNQENIAYNSGICAERVAIFAAGANYNGVAVEAVAVTAYSGHASLNKPLSPCGACRQVMAEYETRQQKPIRVIMAVETGPVRVAPSIKALLPFIFTGEGVRHY